MKNLNPNLPLARFFFKKRDIRADGTPRPSLFKPKAGDLLSVFDVEGMNHSAVCHHGHQHADNLETDRVHKGYVAHTYSVYLALSLTGLYDDFPPRHVSIELPNAEESRRELAKAIVGEFKKESSDWETYFEQEKI